MKKEETLELPITVLYAHWQQTKKQIGKLQNIPIVLIKNTIALLAILLNATNIWIELDWWHRGNQLGQAIEEELQSTSKKSQLLAELYKGMCLNKERRTNRGGRIGNED